MSRQNLRKKQKKSALFAETTYPRKGTVTKHDSELGNAPSETTYPRKGTVTRADILRKIANGNNLSPQGDGNSRPETTRQGTH